MSELETQHHELIQAQLGQLRTAYITQLTQFKHGGPQFDKVLQVGFSANSSVLPDQGGTVLKDDMMHSEVDSESDRTLVVTSDRNGYTTITEEEMVVSTSSQDEQINVSMVMASPLVMGGEEGTNSSHTVKQEQVDLDPSEETRLNRPPEGITIKLSDSDQLSCEPKTKRKCKR